MLSYPKFEGYSRKVLTLTMIFKNNEVLLGMKNRGMGKGKWNGFGGKVEPNETIDNAAERYCIYIYLNNVVRNIYFEPNLKKYSYLVK